MQSAAAKIDVDAPFVGTELKGRSVLDDQFAEILLRFMSFLFLIIGLSEMLVPMIWVDLYHSRTLWAEHIRENALEH